MRTSCSSTRSLDSRLTSSPVVLIPIKRRSFSPAEYEDYDEEESKLKPKTSRAAPRTRPSTLIPQEDGLEDQIASSKSRVDKRTASMALMERGRKVSPGVSGPNPKSTFKTASKSVLTRSAAITKPAPKPILTRSTFVHKAVPKDSKASVKTSSKDTLSSATSKTGKATRSHTSSSTGAKVAKATKSASTQSQNQHAQKREKVIKVAALVKPVSTCIRSYTPLPAKVKKTMA
ncbi:Protein of unknown function [Pyronema omphalodes CBS 100304]|uniref:Uncharacterized protein n=1 Tax=Pyronema omphalodes (strain CBS 100304) TaxID=1076935 RepID=U4LJC7_PYROM|nr:Protein of unknown function [Pyronema omphalodes CBS 100304]